MIAPGDPAPDLLLDDTTGTRFRLSDYRGTAAVLLYFLRSTTCPVCNAHARDLARHRPDFPDTEILLAVPEPRPTAATWQARTGTPFRVVPGRPHDAFGLARKLFGTMQQSGTVLIDPHGTVRHTHHSTSPLTGYDRRSVLAALAET